MSFSPNRLYKKFSDHIIRITTNFLKPFFKPSKCCAVSSQTCDFAFVNLQKTFMSWQVNIQLFPKTMTHALLKKLIEILSTKVLQKIFSNKETF